MKVRVNLTIDYELSDADAHERYGAYDAETVAQSMQAEAERKLLTTVLEDDQRIVNASCTVHPLYG